MSNQVATQHFMGSEDTSPRFLKSTSLCHESCCHIQLLAPTQLLLAKRGSYFAFVTFRNMDLEGQTGGVQLGAAAGLLHRLHNYVGWKDSP